ncbi:MAG: lipoate--protein ligase family protein [Acidimicrobiia bacterium]
MALDMALLASVAGGARPALRLYTWARPALSLGRFQSDDEVDRNACEQLGVEVVRRPTGGKALLHGADLTYAVAIPRPEGAAGKVDAVYCSLASALVAGLARLGVESAIARHAGGAGKGPVCFTTMQGADLRVGARKLCGSAQVRRGGAVLQHGSILLDRLPFDETSLLRSRSGETVPDRGDLRRVTVTVRELGAPHDPQAVGAALVEGFRETLDVEFT